MAHARQQLLESIKTLLKNATTPPWRGVYVAGAVPGKAALPALLIGQPTESGQDAGLIGIRRQQRTLSVTIKGVMQARPSPEETRSDLNAMADAIETAITQASVTLAEDIGYLATDTEEDPDEAGLVSITLTYWMEYATREGRPDTLGTD